MTLRNIKLSGVVLLFTACARLNAAEEVTFKYQPVKSGNTQIVSQEFQSTMKLTVKANGNVVNSVEQNSGKIEKRKITLLEASGDEKTKIRMSYLTSTTTSAEQPLAKTAAYSGKTFVAEKKNGTVIVTDEDGKAVVDPEISIQIAKDATSVMKPERFSKAFDGKVLKAGDKVDITDEMAKDLLGSDDRPGKVEKMDMVLKEIRKGPAGTQGVFSIDVVITGDINVGMKMSMSMKGEAVIAVDTCWPVSMLINGPLTLKGAQQKGDAKIDFDGVGDMKIIMNAEYEK
jgi:hypothetical protein